jgi:hypothetical protein
MDLTAAIRVKIDRLRTAKTARYNALSSAIERDVSYLTNRSAELFTKLEDALEADALGKPNDAEDLKRFKEEEVFKEEKEDVMDEDDDDKTDDPQLKEKHSMHEIYDVDEEAALYYGNGSDEKYYERRPESKEYYDPTGSRHPSLYAGVPRPASRTPSVSAKPPPKSDSPTAKPDTPNSIAPAAIVQAITDLVHVPTKSDSRPESLVSYLRSRAQQTQSLLADKHTSLTQMRQKHDIAMKRLDKLQADLEKVSHKWESEERARIQTESTTVLGKRKREETDDIAHKRWKNWGLKGVEWGVLFGFGVASAVGMNKLNQ